MKLSTPLVAAIACCAFSAHAQILFSDNFSTTGQSDDVNFGFTLGRQSGTLGNLQYRQGNGDLFAAITGTIANESANGFKTQIGNAGGPNSLWLVGGNPGLSIGSISLEHNFIENPGLGGYLSISFTIDPVTGSAGTSGDWGAITLGAADNASFGASGSGARGQGILSSAAHFGILFRDNGQFQAFDGSTNLTPGTVTYSSSPTTTTTHAIELRISGLVDGNPWDGSNDAKIDVFADGGASPFYTFTKTGGYTDNFVTFEALGGGGGFSISQLDNAKFEVVPEPSSFALLIGTAIGTLGLRRRRTLC